MTIWVSPIYMPISAPWCHQSRLPRQRFSSNGAEGYRQKASPQETPQGRPQETPNACWRYVIKGPLSPLETLSATSVEPQIPVMASFHLSSLPNPYFMLILMLQPDLPSSNGAGDMKLPGKHYPFPFGVSFYDNLRQWSKPSETRIVT